MDSSFSHSSLEAYCEHFRRIALDTVKEWRQKITVNENGKIQINLLKEMMSIAMQSIGSTSVGFAFDRSAHLRICLLNIPLTLGNRKLA